MSWARIDNGIVVELTTRDPTGLYHPSMIWVEFDDSLAVDIGWTYDGVALAPPVTPPAIPPSIVTTPDFINRFTGAEKTQIAQACISNSDIFLWWSEILARPWVDLTDSQTSVDMEPLVIGELITDARREEILTPSF